MNRLLSILVLFIAALVIVPSASARIGVGVGTGKIELDETLQPGTLYQLPSVTVLNTGDVDSSYLMDITYHQDQDEEQPPREWFSFSPSTFDLAPGKAQVVEIKLTLPVKTDPGDYFAYLEARPTGTVTNDGGTTIGIAAASKLYFTVQPSNIFQGMWFRAKSLWTEYSPWPQTAIGVVVILGVVRFLRSKIDLNISVKGKQSPQKKDNSTESKPDNDS